MDTEQFSLDSQVTNVTEPTPNDQVAAAVTGAPESDIPRVQPDDTSCEGTTFTDLYATPVSITPSDDGGMNVFAFDIVINLSYTVNLPDNTQRYQNAKILKTVAFNKGKLLDEVLSSKVSIVENKKESQKPVLAEKSLNNLRVLAGIPGKKTFI
jgi:hypothetical protein